MSAIRTIWRRYGKIAAVLGVLAAAGAAAVSGCDSYPVVLLRENMLSDTPYMLAKNHPKPKDWPADRITATWVGHATVLVNFYGTTILTDPVLGERLEPPRLGRANIGIRRITELPVKFELLPPIDAVLLSHAHQDHWDTASLEMFGDKTLAIVPAGDADLVPPNIATIVELDWGGVTLVKDVTVRAFRVRHWGERIGAPNHPRGYNGYVLTGHGRTVVFVGDTAGAPWDWGQMSGVSSADMVILPIGEYVYAANHQTPEQAWDFFNQVGGKKMLATHWRTFILSPRDKLPTFEPMERLTKAAGGRADAIVCKEPGDVVEVP